MVRKEPLWLLVVTMLFTEGGLGVNGNLLNYPETVTPYHNIWAPLVGGGLGDIGKTGEH